MKSLKVKVFVSILFCCFYVACKFGLKQENLIGRWNYVSYEYTNKSLEKPLANIAVQKPYIQFYENGDCKIISSGKVISEGVYHLEKKIIRYTEALPNAQTRAIPFLIQSLTENELVFQTMDAEVKVIKAVKD